MRGATHAASARRFRPRCRGYAPRGRWSLSSNRATYLRPQRNAGTVGSRSRPLRGRPDDAPHLFRLPRSMSAPGPHGQPATTQLRIGADRCRSTEQRCMRRVGSALLRGWKVASPLREKARLASAICCLSRADRTPFRVLRWKNALDAIARERMREEPMRSGGSCWQTYRVPFACVVRGCDAASASATESLAARPKDSRRRTQSYPLAAKPWRISAAFLPHIDQGTH